MITNEYTTLIKGDEEIKILPNVPFESIPSGYKITAYATVKDEKGNIVAILKPGETTPHDLPNLSTQELRELCIESGLSFKKTAKKQELIELLSC